jgi:hypothetical protein
MEISRERVGELAKKHGSIQSYKPNPCIGRRRPWFNGLDGFAAVAETAATNAYPSQDRMARSALGRCTTRRQIKKQNHGEESNFIMMTHDPFQNNYQTQGAYPGVTTPFGLPLTAFQPSFNPMAVAGQPHPGLGGPGIYPQQLQGAGIAGQQGPLQQPFAFNPFAAVPQNPALQNPLLQHPLAQVPWQNQQFAAGSQYPLQNPVPAYYGWPQPQQQFGNGGGIGQPSAYGWPQPQQQFGNGGGIGQPSAYGWPQPQQQFGYPLAPQSLIGAGGVGSPFGQIHPLAQLALRQAAGYGISPLAGCF